MNWMSSLSAVCTALAVTAFVSAQPAEPGRTNAELDPAGVEYFETHVRPVLVKRCYQCHSKDAEKLRGGLRLDHRQGWAIGGDSGPAITPGKPEASRLIAAVSYQNPDLQMPPKGKLPAHEIEALAKWVRMGAPDPRESSEPAGRRDEIDMEAGRKFWAFVTPKAWPAPRVNNEAWPRSDVDRFLLARMEEAGLQPVADADRPTLIRRVYFDLIGLPPTQGQIDAFVNDPAPLEQALAKVVDELLASPRFGERWGRHWLDVVRFAEASGGGRELIFNNAWRFRDYVIESFNADKPYDQLVREHVAGDLLPHTTAQQRAEQLTGSGFLMLGPINYELQDKELLRMEVIDEQITVTGKTFMAMTLGCARCHDHKFDPISAEDYYALAGIFRSTKSLLPGNVSKFVEQPLPPSPQQEAALKAHAKAVDELEKSLSDARQLVKDLGGTPKPQAQAVPGGSVASASLAGIVIDDEAAKVEGNWTKSDSVSRFVDGHYLHASSPDATVTFTPRLPRAGEYEVRVTYAYHGNRASNTLMIVRHADGEKQVRINQQEVPPIGGVAISLGRFRFESGTGGSVIVSGKGANGVVIADAVQFIAGNPTPAVAKDEADSETPDEPSAREEAAERQREAKLAAARQSVKELEADLDNLKKKAPPGPAEVMSVYDEKQTDDYHLCIRGDAHNLGPKVPRGFVTVATPASLQARPELPEGQSGRLQLAQWLTHPDHPLTARVMVNRIWHHLLGHGIVRTTDNFGSTGEMPSHPKLLDWLAVRFVDDGWSVKSMIRRIVLSRAYGMSSRMDAANAATDGENRLLWRMNRRRLDAECIRDAMLFVSGELDLTQGGRTMRPGTRSSFGYNFQGNRRSVYIPVFRNTIMDVLQVFDFADPNLVMGRRNVSTLPTQALFLLNSPFAMEQAEHAAQRLLSEPSLTDGQRIDLAFRRTLGRLPTPRERDLAQGFIARSLASLDGDDEARRLKAWSDFMQSLFASVDFRYVR